MSQNTTHHKQNNKEARQISMFQKPDSHKMSSIKVHCWVLKCAFDDSALAVMTRRDDKEQRVVVDFGLWVTMVIGAMVGFSPWCCLHDPWAWRLQGREDTKGRFWIRESWRETIAWSDGGSSLSVGYDDFSMGKHEQRKRGRVGLDDEVTSASQNLPY